MAEQKQDDRHEHIFSNFVRIRDVVQKTCQRRLRIGKSGERGSGISMLPARHDDDDDDDICTYTCAHTRTQIYSKEEYDIIFQRNNYFCYLIIARENIE